VPHQSEVVGASHSPGAGADDGYAAWLLGFRPGTIDHLKDAVPVGCLDTVFFSDEALEGPNADGIIEVLSATSGFTGMGADSPADGGEGVGATGDRIGLLVTLGGNQ